ncbi:MAG: glycoside hydrolase family 125 protein, partial [Bacillota bacterium]
MPTRREFIKTTFLASAALGSFGSGLSFGKPRLGKSCTQGFISQRPPENKRKFVSEAVEAKIKVVKNSISDDEIAWLFENCFPNTLDTTVELNTIDGKPDTFVITGDIHAMWLRDSTAQVWPYLPLTNQDKKLKELIAGVINRQVKCILIDPYANAFNSGPTGSHWEKDLTKMKPELHERKWEIDSLCYPVRLSYGYWKTTNDASAFDKNWQLAMKLIVKTFIEQQRKVNPGPYSFQRVTSWQSDTVPLSGWGNPTRPVGLIHSMFRPSDDCCVYPFLIPSNLFAQKTLLQLSEIFLEVFNDRNFSDQCSAFSEEIHQAIENY